MQKFINICQPSSFLYPSAKGIAQQVPLKGDHSIDERNVIAFHLPQSVYAHMA